MRIASCVVQPVRVHYDETVSGAHLVVRLQTDAGIERWSGTKTRCAPSRSNDSVAVRRRARRQRR
jgi:hypothetical protein